MENVPRCKTSNQLFKCLYPRLFVENIATTFSILKVVDMNTLIRTQIFVSYTNFYDLLAPHNAACK